MENFGWRKLSAWGLIYALVAVASWYQIEIASNNADLIKWVTAFFFGANALEHMGQSFQLNLTPKK